MSDHIYDTVEAFRLSRQLNKNSYAAAPLQFIEYAVGEALIARGIEFKAFTGLGPVSAASSRERRSWGDSDSSWPVLQPDLCCLEKVWERNVAIPFAADHRTGYYHWVAGVDTSSPAGVTAHCPPTLPLSWTEPPPATTPRLRRISGSSAVRWTKARG